LSANLLARAGAHDYIARLMRKDMSKVIVERPRTGRSRAGLRSGRTRVVADDDGEPLRTSKGAAREPKQEPPKTKSLNENLNPLKRYLAAQVGRPWNKVYAEISEHLKPSSTVQQHVRDHLDDFVATRTRMQKGVVMVTPRFGGERPLAEDYSLYYVHPRTGLLRKNEHCASWNARRRRARAKAAADLAQRVRVVDAATQLHLFGETWWEVKLAKIGHVTHKDAKGRSYRAPQNHVDVVKSARLSMLAPEALYGRHDVYAVAKRPLSKAEMKRLKLR
jgi:hypothetical protein